MKILRLVAVFSALSLAGCVSTPSESKPEPQRKERTETVRIPVLLSEASFFANGVLDRTITYTYNADKSLLQERTVQEPSRSDPTERTLHTYSEGLLASVSILDYEGKVKTRTDFARDPAGRMVQEIVLDAKGAVKSSSKYEYDDAGNCISRKVYDGSESLLAASEYAYSSGRLSIVIIKDAAGRPAGRIENEYDTEGRLVTRTTYDPAGLVDRRDRFAYANGVLTEERTEQADGRLERRKVYETGPDGVPVKSTLYDGSGRVRDMRTYEHTFRVEERTVVYYD